MTSRPCSQPAGDPSLLAGNQDPGLGELGDPVTALRLRFGLGLRPVASEFLGPLGTQVGGGSAGGANRVVLGCGHAHLHHQPLGTVLRQNRDDQRQHSVPLGLRGHRNRFADVESGIGGPFRHDADAGVGVVEFLKDADELLVLAAAFETGGSQPGVREDVVQVLGDEVEAPHGLEVGGSGHQAVDLAGAHLLQEFEELSGGALDERESGVDAQQLRAAQAGARGYHRSLGKLLQGQAVAGHQRVTLIAAFQDGREGQARHLLFRDAVHAVYHQVEIATHQAETQLPHRLGIAGSRDVHHIHVVSHFT